MSIARFVSAIAAATLLFSASARAEDKLYEIQKTDQKVSVGGKGAASVTIAAKGGWHLNGDAPISLALTAPTGVTIAKLKLSRADLAASSQQSARFDVPFEALEVGAKVVTAEARFVLCQEQACKPVKETLALNIDVAASAPAAPAKAVKAKGKAKKS
jgi:hypothetical protein